MRPQPAFRPLLAALMITASPLAAQDDAPARLELPLLDAPYNFAHGYRAPSMQQSLSVTTGFYEASHYGIQKAWGERKWLARGSILLFDYFTFTLPFGGVWLHEEYHRAVMGHRGIDSFNDVYKFNVFAEAIAVSRVKDEDLIRLKRDHPAEQVRLGAAGIEGEQQLVLQLEKNRFFRGTRGWHLPLYWLTTLGNWGYVFSGTFPEVNEWTEEFNQQDGANVPVRDFTGHDFTAWAYDLFRPGEPYEARGVHPSGVGIDRYRKPADLTAEELDFLELQGRLALLNFLDPNLFGIYGFTFTSPFSGRPTKVNARAGHMLTSFGYTVDANIFLKQEDLNLFVVLHSYANGARRFPGVDAQVLDLPVAIGGKQFMVSPRAAMWLQPQDQQFRPTSGTVGGLAAIRVDHPLAARFGSYMELEGKTAGWVAGNVHLDANLSLRLGVTSSLR